MNYSKPSKTWSHYQLEKVHSKRIQPDSHRKEPVLADMYTNHDYAHTQPALHGMCVYYLRGLACSEL